MKKILAITWLALICAGCSSSPDPDYFTLAPVAGTVSPDIETSIKIQRPALPGYLDRDEMVRQDAYQLSLNDTRLWAEPVDIMFERIMAADLRQRLPASTIITESDENLTTTQMNIAIDVQQFNGTDDGQVALQAQVLLRDKGVHQQPDAMPISLRTQAGSSGASMAEGLSVLIGQLADHLTLAVRSQIAADHVNVDHAATSPAITPLIIVPKARF